LSQEIPAQDERLERIDGLFSGIYLMLGITMVAVTIPLLQKLFG
jgi:hypothetical protein